MSKKVVCFGEVLWDVLPTEKKAGGAPMNVAIRLQSLNIPSQIISRVGKDSLGKELLGIIQNKKTDISFIQQDNNFPTGEVLVTLNEFGNAAYDIVYPSAWDNIELSEENIAAVKNADAFVFGSLACRSKVSQNTLLNLLGFARYKIFDVNIRSPFYSVAFIHELMQQTDFIKLNDEELLKISEDLGSEFSDIEENIRFISQETSTNGICVTKGENGAVLFMNNQFYKHNGFQVKVADTIGAGDSFLAALISKILYSDDYEEAIRFACATGAIVASHKGANPDISVDEIEEMVKK
jgi:fructokinase